MADLRGAPKSSTVMRWIVLIVVLANCAFIIDFLKLADPPTLPELMADGARSPIPGPIAKIFGVVVAAAVAAFFVAALWPHRRTRAIYDRLVLPLALGAVLTSGYTVAIGLEQFALATALNLAAAGVAAVMLARVAAVSPGAHSGWLRVPFALLGAGTTVAVLFVTAPWWIASIAADGGVSSRGDVMAIALATAAIVGTGVALRLADVAYPAVIAAAAGAIYLAQRAADGPAEGALYTCIGMLAIAVLIGIANFRLPAPAPRRRPSPGHYGEPSFLLETTPITRF